MKQGEMKGHRASTRWWMIAFLVCLYSLAATLAQAATYVYDASGRLRAVTNSSGNSSAYVYDALGNIVRIESVPAGQLALFTFTPNHGPVGTVVKISGSGFSATPANDAVTFNGVPAVVTSASPTELLVTVPNTATTGPVGIAVAGSTVTSSDPFIVTGSDQAPPTISGFTPLIATAGSSVTLNGSNLHPISGQSTVRVDAQIVRPTLLSSISNTQIVFSLASEMGSGPLSVTTPFGRAVSTDVLVVTPSTIAPGDVISTARLTAGGPSAALNIGTANKAGVFVFDATQPWLTLQMSGLSGTATSVPYRLYDPKNRLIKSGSLSAAYPTIHFPELGSGMHSLFLLPGNATAQVTASLETDLAVPLNGGPLAVASTVPSQSKRLMVAGAAGENMGLGLTNLSLAPGSVTYFVATVYRPDGTQLTYANCFPSNAGCDLDLVNLPVSGTYSVVLVPGGVATLSATLTLSGEVTGSLTPDTASALSIARAGQNARLAFTGTAGQLFGLQMASLATTPVNKAVSVVVYKPDGSALGTYSYNAGTSLWNLPALPTTGTYSVFANPAYAATATTSVTLATAVSGTLAVDGSSSSIATILPGQNAYLSFSGTAGQNLGLGLTNLSLAPGTVTSFIANVYKPDGYQLTYAYCYPSTTGCDLDLVNLPATGTYSVVLVPSGAATLSATLTLSSDVTGSLTPDVASALSIARIGQNARLTFAGSAGQQFGLQMASLATTPVNKVVSVTVYKPDGSTLNSNVYNAGTTLWNMPVLPATGTYTVFVNPGNAATATASVTLATAVSGSLVVNGASSSVATTLPGQNAYLSFSGTAGQNLGLGLTSLSLAPGTVTYFTAYVYKPDGTQLTYAYCYPANAGCDLDLPNLPATGTYAVVLVPSGAATLSAALTLSTDATGSLTPDTASALSIANPGQNARLTFAGTAGQRFGLQLASLATTPANKAVSVVVYKPDGSTLGSNSYSNGTSLWNLPALPATGTYTVFVNPAYAATASTSVTLATAVSGTLTVDGVSSSIATALPGQNVYLSFSGTAGQNLGLGLASLSLTPGAVTYFTAYVYKPDGVQLTYAYCYPANTGCDLEPMNLPVTGAYGITLVPGGVATLGATATLSTEATGTLTLASPATVTISREGQNARYGFSGTAAQTLRLNWTGLATTPSSRNVLLVVLKPDGTMLTQATVSAATPGGLDLPALPTTGSYAVLVNPQYAATATLTLTLVTR